MADGLSVKLGADIDDLTSGLRKAGQELSNFGKRGSEASKPLDILNKQLERLQRISSQNLSFDQLSRVSGLIKKTQSDIKSLESTSTQSAKVVQGNFKNASTSVINFSRVVQDAPYAFSNFGAIANNIDPLFESFRRLTTEAGGVGGAFKALGSSLIGGAGIGLAISVVTSLVTSFSIGLFGTSQQLKQGEQAVNDFTSSLDDLKNALSDVKNNLQFLNQLGSINVKIFGLGDLADLEQQSVAQKEQTQKLIELREKAYKKLTSLSGNIENVNKKIIDDQKKHDLELNGVLSDNYNSYKLTSDQLIDLRKKASTELESIDKDLVDSRQKQAILYRQIELQKVEDAREAQKKAEELRKRELELLNERAEILSDYVKKFAQLTKATIEKTNVGIEFKIPEIDFSKFSKDTKKANEQLKEFLKQAFDISSDIAKAFTEPAAQITIEEYVKNLKEKIKKTSIVFDAAQLQIQAQGELTGADKLVNSTYDRFKKAFDKKSKQDKGNSVLFNLGLPDLSGLFDDAAVEKLAKQFSNLTKNAGKGFDELKDKFEEFKAGIKQAAELTAGLLVPAFTDLFTAIFEGGNGLTAFFESLGNQVKKLITQLLAAAAVAAVLSAITGGSFGSVFGKLTGLKFGKGLAEGGIVPQGFPNDSFPARLTSGEVVTPLSRLQSLVGNSGNVTVSGRLRGKDIYLSNQRESRRLQRVA